MTKKLLNSVKKKVSKKSAHTTVKSSKSKMLSDNSTGETAKKLFSKMKSMHQEINHKKTTIAALRFDVERLEMDFETLRNKHAEILSKIEAGEKSK